jgi:hypothetical protein
MHIRSRIKPQVAIVAALGAVMLAACSSPSPPAAPPPSTISDALTGGLVARTATVDLGRVPFNVMAEGRFELVNTSARPVKLLAPPQVKMLEGC